MTKTTRRSWGWSDRGFGRLCHPYSIEYGERVMVMDCSRGSELRGQIGQLIVGYVTAKQQEEQTYIISENVGKSERNLTIVLNECIEVERRCVYE